MLQKHSLPINTNPPVIYGLHHARPLSLIMAYEESLPWFFSNYIQLCFLPEEQESPGIQRIDFAHSNPNTNSPLSRISLNKNNIYFKNEDIVELTINWLNNGHYVEFFLNESEIPGTKCYLKKKPKRHAFIFFGYDLSSKTLKTLNFNEKGQFTIINIDFETITKVYNSEITVKMNDIDGRIAVLFEYVNNLYVDLKPNTSLIKESLYDYINSTNTIIKYKYLINYPFKTQSLRYVSAVFGISIYKELISYLRVCFDKKGNIDFRIFHALWEHKKIMIDRISYLEKIKVIEEDKIIMDMFKNFEKTSFKVRSLIIKYGISKDESDINRCINYLNYLYESEPFYIEKLINNIL